MPPRSATALWEAALGHLQLQVTRANFETWLRDSRGLSLDDGRFTVSVPSDFVAEWLANRLQDPIAKTLASIVGRPVQVAFQVEGITEDQPSAPSVVDPLRPSQLVPLLPKPRLNPLFTFDTFVIADCNRLAHAAASAAARRSSSPEHNPLFLYGESGLGKTHLMHAIAERLLEQGCRVLYVTAEQYLSEFVFASRQKRNDDFRAKYRSLDALLLDDIQFLAGKERTQEEFFHTFNHLQSNAKQVVLASDQPPQSLTRISPRLRSRFQSGLTADLAMFPAGGRLAFLRKKAPSLHADVEPAALDYLAAQAYANVRELEGALNRVVAYARLTGRPVDLCLVHAAIKCNRPEVPASPPSTDCVIDAVCSHYDVSLQSLRGQSRGKRVTTARHVAMYLLRHDSCQPLAHIGRLFGDRDHSTVLYACRKIDRESTAIFETGADLQAIRKQIESAQA
ncbi:MAG: chromosomal replication initiator protein DnaA [Dehalococcoidia bacterium]|jgi:chromosomal replication initiator protein